jgi:hypothetical protein
VKVNFLIVCKFAEEQLNLMNVESVVETELLTNVLMVVLPVMQRVAQMDLS